MSKIIELKSDPDYKGFVEHLWAFNDAGAPTSMEDLKNLANKYHTPIPIGFDEDNNPIFKERL